MESLEKRMLERGITSFTDTSTGEVTTPEEPQLGVKLTDDDES